MQIVTPRGMELAHAMSEGKFSLTSEGKAYSFIEVGSTFDMAYEANPAQEVLSAWLKTNGNDEWVFVPASQILVGDLIRVPSRGDAAFEVLDVQSGGSKIPDSTKVYLTFGIHNEDHPDVNSFLVLDTTSVTIKRTTEME